METKEFIIHLNKKQPGAKKGEIEKEAKINARGFISKYKNQKLSGSFIDKISYYIT